MMGVSFGTNDFIDNHVGKLIGNYIKHLQRSSTLTSKLLLHDFGCA